MPDVFTKSKRSEVMSRIRGHGNKDTELALIRVFRSQRIAGWRRQVRVRFAVTRPSRARSGAGRREKARSSSVVNRAACRVFRCTPDFVFPKLQVAVFVDGCFWHGCPLHATKPRNNAVFWQKKLALNQTRDRLVNQTLRVRGWRVIRFWEHELAHRNERRLLRRIHRLLV